MKARITKQVLTCFLICSTCLFGWVSQADALSKHDKEIFYKAVEAETREVDTYEEKLNVANVILNRVNSPRFPNNVKDVIYQKTGKYYQFSVVPDGSLKAAVPTKMTKKAVDDALEGKWGISDKVMYFNVIGLKCWASNNKQFWGKDSIHEFYYE